MKDQKADFIAPDLAIWREQIKKELNENHDRIVFSDLLEEIQFDITQKPLRTFNTNPKEKNTFLNGFYNSVFDEKKSNKQVLSALMEGADFLEFKIVKESSINWSLLFHEIQFQYISTQISFSNSAQLASFLKFIKTEELNYFLIKIDPLSSNFQESQEILTKNSVKVPSYCINGFELEQIGATCFQQIGVMLSTFHELLALEIKKGKSITNFIHSIHFSIGIGQNYFIEIAKIKTLKWLLQQIAHSYGIKNFIPNITANIGWMNKSLNDQETNLLRQTTEAMAALNGGVQNIIVHPFDYFSTKRKSMLYQRMALNIPIILKEESYFNLVHEPMNGSNAIEGISAEISKKSWSFFKELEKFECLISLEKIAKIKTDILKKREIRIEELCAHKKEYLGINCMLSDNCNTNNWKDVDNYFDLPYLILEQEFLRK